MVIQVISSENLVTLSAKVTYKVGHALNELVDLTEIIYRQNNVKGATNFVQLCVIISRFRKMNHREEL